MINRIIFNITVVSATVFLSISCTKEYDPYIPLEHVLLIYMGGDNNLSYETEEKIEAVRKGWNGNPSTRVVIYQDATGKGASLIEVVKDNKQNILRTIRNYKEENSSDSKVLKRVIDDIRILYPAPSYGMLLFSHASGWLPRGSLIKPKAGTKSFFQDGEDEMELVDFAAAITDKAFEYIVFETCFSSGIEVAYQLRNKTEYILASSAEIVSPGFTYIYPEIINELLNKDIKAFAQKAFDYFNRQSGNMQSATFSIIKTSELETLAAFIRQNGDFTKEIGIDGIQHFDRYSYRLFFDFEDYYSKLIKQETKEQELKRLINNCVVWKASTKQFMCGYNGFTIKKHSGLTTYIFQNKFPALNQAHKKTEWGKVISVSTEGK